ncbi:MAG: Mur ligase domain-containing protein [Acidimicrobiia bacterium]|nr:Mur ligase domain-containing protein [Acidimicrobiia bacterium]
MRADGAGPDASDPNDPGEPIDIRDFREFDAAVPARVHVVGVGGAGMSAIALVLAGMGHSVSGSDLKATPVLERLGLAGVVTCVGHRPENVAEGTGFVVISTAVPPTNPEVLAARERGIPVLRRAEVLSAIVATRRCAAVAGSHGKTTTSSMLALVLRSAGFRPGFIIGGELNEIGTNAAWDSGEWIVVEADESDGTFLELDVEAAVVTNVEPDHLDHYGGFDQLVDGFHRFCGAVEGPLVVCADDPIAARLAESCPGALTYGVAEGAEYRMAGYAGEKGEQVRSAARRPSAGGDPAPGPGPAQRQECGGRGGSRSRWGPASRTSPPRSPASAVSPGGSSIADVPRV